MVELSGVLRTWIWLPWCYCSNTLLSVRDSAKYGFLLLVLICHNCGDTSHFQWAKEVFLLFNHTIGFFLVLWVFCCFQISVLACIGSKIIELLKSNFIFGFVKIYLFYSTILQSKQVFWTILSFFCKIFVKSTASTLIWILVHCNFKFLFIRLGDYFFGQGWYPLALCSLGHIVCGTGATCVSGFLWIAWFLPFFQFSRLFKSELF